MFFLFHPLLPLDHAGILTKTIRQILLCVRKDSVWLAQSRHFSSSPAIMQIPFLNITLPFLRCNSFLFLLFLSVDRKNSAHMSRHSDSVTSGHLQHANMDSERTVMKHVTLLILLMQVLCGKNPDPRTCALVGLTSIFLFQVHSSGGFYSHLKGHEDELHPAPNGAESTHDCCHVSNGCYGVASLEM